MLTRRGVLGAAIGALAFRDGARTFLARLDPTGGHPDDEGFWSQLRAQFDLDPGALSFNHAGLSPSPRAVREAMERAARLAEGNPSRVVFRDQRDALQPVRERLARLLGCSAEELALTPNATHGLHTSILGLDLRRGDEVLLTDQEYSRTQAAVQQRCRRDGVVAVEVPLAAPGAAPAAVADSVIARIGDRTKLIVLSQVTYVTGQVLPIAEVARVAARRGIPLLVDGAHGVGLLAPTCSLAGAPFYTACLHKWLMGPVGTGVFVVQAPWIARLWPLHPADELHGDSIVKFEQWGTHAVAPFLALDEALDLHEQLGTARIAGRLDHLRGLLAGHLCERPGIVLATDPTPGRSAAMLAVEVARVPAEALAAWLWREHRIHVTTAPLGARRVLRLSPHLFTTPEEISRVAAAIGAAAEQGI